MMSALDQTQDQLITTETLEPALNPYIQTVQNNKTHLLTPGQANGLVLILVEILMENYTDKLGLRLLASILNSDAYEELCNERIINHYCGYPLCPVYDPAKIKSNTKKQELKFLEGYYKNSYCCKLHYQSNEFYKRQLSEELIFLRTDLFKIREGIIFLDDLLDELSRNKDKSMLSIIENMTSLSIADQDKSSELAGLVEHFEIVENVNVEPPSPSRELDLDDGYEEPDESMDGEGVSNYVRGKRIEGYVYK